ncbi:MAG: type IV secretion system protein VirD4, partial [Bacillota bacterium]
NCNTYIIQRQNSPAGAERMAAVIGTRPHEEVTYQIQADPLLGTRTTGVGTVRQTREFVVHPDQIKQLQVGEAILVRKNPYRVQHVRIRQP